MPTLEEFKTMSQDERRELISKNPPELEDDEEEVCRECGNTPETGACYFCKMD